tara:strand:- start:848 stop:1552 length:705 start_codon:yes stop_codon:yes gene_type:complete
MKALTLSLFEEKLKGLSFMQLSTMKLPSSRLERAGFTLIEIMIVLLVVGILFGITFTGASYLFTSQQEKKALADIEALKLALEDFKIEFGDYPRTDVNISNQDEEFLRGQRLFQALAGFVDKRGIPYGDQSERPRSFLKSDAISLGEKEGSEFRQVSLSMSVLQSSSVPEYALIDSWDIPYVYEYPRRDGNLGYLLFSKGPDQEASTFSSEQANAPERQDSDYDNLPPSEPGKW